MSFMGTRTVEGLGKGMGPLTYIRGRDQKDIKKTLKGFLEGFLRLVALSLTLDWSP